MTVEQFKDRIGEGLSRLKGRPIVSFEFFPPKDEPMEQAQGFVVRPWSVQIAGEVARPQTVNLEDILRRSRA